MLKITAIPAFTDNYIWLLESKDQAVVVDPGDADVVLTYLTKHQLKLSTILVTHWHPDHIGGINDLLKHHSALVIGPQSENIPQVEKTVSDNESINVLDCEFTAITVPGHTMDHIAYYTASGNSLFCGDTLFAGGCGRMFEGTPDVFLSSLNKLSHLPENTNVYCAHEYTLSNLQFALEAEPDNTELQNRLIDCQKQRANNIPTVPSTIKIEKETNPFLRTSEKSVITQALNQGAASTSSVDVFACLREWKNNF